MSYPVHNPKARVSSANTLITALCIPRDPLRVHIWITAGITPSIIHRLAGLVRTNVITICNLVGISRSTITRKLRSDTSLSTEQGTRVYGVVLALDAALSLYKGDTVSALSCLYRPARGLGGIEPVELLVTLTGVQAVIDLMGRIEHGVCQ